MALLDVLDDGEDRSLRDDVHQVTVPTEIAGRARAAIDRMMATL